MIYLIIKSYLTILFSVGLGAIFIFSLGLYFIFRSPTKHSSKIKNPQPLIKNLNDDVSLQPIDGDLNAIAGDDVFATQLDLARAYCEVGKKQLALDILQSVALKGSTTQQLEAQQLLNSL